MVKMIINGQECQLTYQDDGQTASMSVVTNDMQSTEQDRFDEILEHLLTDYADVWRALADS